MAQRKTLDEANNEDLAYVVAEHELGLPVGSFRRTADRSAPA